MILFKFLFQIYIIFEMKNIILCFKHDVSMAQKSEDGWTRVSLPKSLTDKIRQMLEEEGVEYNSISSFIQDAVRRRLEELEKIRLVGEEYNLDEKEVKRMAEFEHVNIAENNGKTIIAIKDNSDGHIYDVYLSKDARGRAKMFCEGDKSFDCVHVKYVYFILLPKLNKLIEEYKKKRRE